MRTQAITIWQTAYLGAPLRRKLKIPTARRYVVAGRLREGNMRAFLTLLALLMAGFSHADFLRWSADTEEDPCSGRRVKVNFMSSVRSGVFIICDTVERGLTVAPSPGSPRSRSGRREPGN